MTFSPDCMTDAEYDDWRYAAEEAQRKAGVKLGSVCDDCAPAWREAMLEVGRCNRPEPEYVNGKRSSAAVTKLVDDVTALRDCGLPWSDIGRRLGIDASYVRVLWHRREREKRSRADERRTVAA